MKFRIYFGRIALFASLMVVMTWLCFRAGFTLGRDGFCPSQVGTGCLRDWLGATSGWIAALAAAITLLLTLGPLREQAKHARRQTDFMLGDADPTFDAIQHLKKSDELVTRIVNWNRSAAVVRLVRTVENTDALVIIEKLTIDNQDIDTEIISFSVEPFVIKGWEDRGSRPHFAEVRFVAYDSEESAGLNRRLNWSRVPKVVAEVQILGAKHRTVFLEADTAPIS